jgi:cytidylate kinase
MTNRCLGNGVIHGTGVDKESSKMRATARIDRSQRICLIPSGFGCGEGAFLDIEPCHSLLLLGNVDVITGPVWQVLRCYNSLPGLQAQSVSTERKEMAIITISRGSYSRGKEIAEKVAERLDYFLLSRDILLQASEEFNIPEIRLVRALHDAPSVLDRFSHGKERYVAFIQQALLEQVQGDNVVYHGLAGHFFLRGVSHVLKVRIIADMEDRVHLEMNREGIDEKEARRILKKDDEERRHWALSLYGVDTVDSSLYDLVINVAAMEVECAVEIICHIAPSSPCFETTAASQAGLQNLLLAARVRSAVICEWPNARLSAADGVVFIDVEAPLSQENKVREQVMTIASTVTGVAEVRVNIRPSIFP